MESAVPIDDRGLLLGDGLFETVLVRAGEPVLWDAHLDRLARGCGVLGLPGPDRGRVLAEARAAIERAGLARARAAVRITWTAGSGGRGLARPSDLQPRLIVSAAASGPASGPASVILSSVRRNAGSPASRLKTLAYLDNVLARREAEVKGADEAIMLDTDGRLACASAANLFWITEGRLFTPSLACGVLDGIMRAQVIAATGAEAVQANPRALRECEGAVLTNSLIGLRTISSVDGRALPEHPLIGELCGRLAALL